MKERLLIISLSLIVGFFITTTFFNNDPVEIIKTETVIEYKVDTVRDTITSYVPQFVYRDTGSFNVEYRYYDIDTSEILRTHFEKILYIDSLSRDSIYDIIIKDTVSQNRILWRDVSVNLLDKKKFINTTITKIPTQEIFIGAGVGKFGDKTGLTASLSYRQRSSLYHFNYDLINKNYTISLSKRLWMK